MYSAHRPHPCGCGEPDEMDGVKATAIDVVSLYNHNAHEGNILLSVHSHASTQWHQVAKW